MSNVEWVYGLLFTILGILLLWRVRARLLERSKFVATLGRRDRNVALLVILPATALFGTILFRVIGEQWTLANVVTVYGGIFGTISAIYALSKI